MTVDNRQNWELRNRREKWSRYLSLLFLLIVAVLFYHGIDVRINYVADAPAQLTDLFARMFPPDLGILPSLVQPTIDTIHMSILSTLFAVVVSIPVAVLAAENLSPNKVTYGLGKFIISATRSVHDIIWALIFVLIFGPGILAGLLGMGLKSVGFIGKFFAEEIEEIDRETVKAVRATGANRWMTMIYGIVPQIKAPFVGITMYRWDVNVRAATIVGLVGAGGIGVELNAAMGLLYWQDALTILLIIVALVIVSEVVSAYFRDKVQ